MENLAKLDRDSEKILKAMINVKNANRQITVEYIYVSLHGKCNQQKIIDILINITKKEYAMFFPDPNLSYYVLLHDGLIYFKQKWWNIW